MHLLTGGAGATHGHEVTLFASGDSRSDAKLRAICEYSVIEAMAKGDAYEYEHYANASIVQAIREGASFDVIHCHLGYTQTRFVRCRERQPSARFTLCRRSISMGTEAVS